jgi:hypothetical protein
LLEAMPPFLGGGHMIASVSEQESRYADPPARFEAGTSPIAEAVGLGTACDFLSEIGMEAVRAHSRDIVGYAVERLREVPGLVLHGPADLGLRGSPVLLLARGSPPPRHGEILARDGVCVRAGHHCAQPLMKAMGVHATTRASFALHSTPRGRRRAHRRPGRRPGDLRLMDQLYREYILDHYKNPHNWGELEEADLEFEDTNPLCGDELKVQLRVDAENRVSEIAFSGHGCASPRRALPWLPTR